jgi:predicted secreted protein
MKNAAGKAFGEQVWVRVQVPAPPTAVPPPTAIPAAGISFTADRYQITAGESTWLNWNVTGVQSVWLCTQPGPTCKGVTGQGREQVWPPATTTYVLRVQHKDNRTQDVPLTITVTPPANAPTIVNFSTDRSTISAGEGLNLWWKVQGNASRIALVRDGRPLKDYALAEEGYMDQPPGTGRVTYELQVWGPGGGEPQKQQRYVTIEGNLPPPATVDVYGCGGGQNLHPGDTLRIHLEAAGGTGYEWGLKEVDPNVLMPLGVDRQEASVPGGPAVYTFSFRAQPGSTTVVLILYRPSEGAESAAETCEIPVIVQ